MVERIERIRALYRAAGQQSRNTGMDTYRAAGQTEPQDTVTLDTDWQQTDWTRAVNEVLESLRDSFPGIEIATGSAQDGDELKQIAIGLGGGKHLVIDQAFLDKMAQGPEEFQEGCDTLLRLLRTLQDGELVLSDDGVLIRMNREKPETDVSVSAMNENATIDDFIGVWTLVRVTTDGMTLPAETVEMAGDTLTIYGDTCDLTMQGMTLDGLPCRMEGYSLLVSIIEGDASITLREDGTLILESVDIALQYERAGDAPDTLDGEATPEPTAEPAHEPAVTGTEIMLENKYVLIDADVNGYNMTAAMLGNYEYSVLLHQDGTVDFVMAGADIPGLVWTYGKVPTDAGELDGVIIDYYGQPLYLVPTDSGFDMDYFDSMRMHFAPEGSAQ